LPRVITIGLVPTRPSHDEYFMGIALAVRERANCLGSRVGAVLVLQERVISTGYNGVPEGMTNCDQGGCDRCANRDKYVSGTAYDVCICVHAEQNALIAAARRGTPVEDSLIYTTTRPCFGCAKELLQAKVQAVYYLNDWAHPDEDLRAEYDRLQAAFPRGVNKLDMADPREAWARGRAPAVPEETGHSAEGA
jgi:dCMP deaminase